MLNNPEIIKDKYACNKIVADWLIYKGHLPLLGMDKCYYYFAKTDDWKMAMNNMPFYVKMMEWF
jgi:hypothetical protein